jgi:hypothetical protein
VPDQIHIGDDVFCLVAAGAQGAADGFERGDIVEVIPVFIVRGMLFDEGDVLFEIGKDCDLHGVSFIFQSGIY